MAAGSTYSTIATTTLGGSATSYTFSSIPSTYTDLVVVVSAILVSGGLDLAIRFNGDTGTNYSATLISGNGTSATSTRETNSARGLLDYNGTPSTTAGAHTLIVNVMNYSNSTTYKTAIARSNNAASGTDANVVLWRSTAAINSLTILSTNVNSIASGSTLTLYGIAAA